MNFHIRPTTVAVLTLLGCLPLAQAGTTPFGSQDRIGIVFNMPFDGNGFQFKSSSLNLTYQKINMTGHGSVNGWQVSIGSLLNGFVPLFSVSALNGKRCAYGSVGVSYGNGQWGVPLFINVPYARFGLSNAGGLGGFVLGVSSMGCFDRYVPSTAPAASSSGSSGSGSSGSGSGSGSSSGSGGIIAVQVTLVSQEDFNWA